MNAAGPPRESLVSLLDQALSRDAGRTFVCFGQERHSYAEIERASNRLAGGLIAAGVAPGDRVATMLDNCVEAVVALFAVAKIDAVLVPLNTALRRDFLRRPLIDSGAVIVITEAEYIRRITELADDAGALRTILCRDADHSAGIAADGLAVRPLDTALADAPDRPAMAPRPADLAMIVYTSGTTGASKGCMLSHNYICNIGRMGVTSVGQCADDVLWTALPLFHINAMGTLLAALYTGARVVMERRFSLSGFWPSIEASGATIAYVLGSMSPLITAAEDTDASRRCHGRLRTVVGAPFPRAMRERWKERFGVATIVVPGFGQTEAALITSVAAGRDAPADAAGHRNDEFEVRIVDDHDNDVPNGTAGELICRPRYPNIMFEGYWHLPERTAEAMRGGWYHTGDIGRFDERGYFYFLGRKAEYLRCRGENVSALEVEATFLAHGALEDVAVYGIASPLGEDDIMLSATVKPHAGLTEEALFLWACERLPHFAMPRYIEFLVELPRNPLGKIEKYKLAARGPTANAWVSPRPPGRGHGG